MPLQIVHHFLNREMPLQIVRQFIKCENLFKKAGNSPKNQPHVLLAVWSLVIGYRVPSPPQK